MSRAIGDLLRIVEIGHFDVLAARSDEAFARERDHTVDQLRVRLVGGKVGQTAAVDHSGGDGCGGQQGEHNR